MWVQIPPTAPKQEVKKLEKLLDFHSECGIMGSVKDEGHPNLVKQKGNNMKVDVFYSPEMARRYGYGSYRIMETGHVVKATEIAAAGYPSKTPRRYTPRLVATNVDVEYVRCYRPPKIRWDVIREQRKETWEEEQQKQAYEQKKSHKSYRKN